MAVEYLTFYQDRFRGGVTGGGFSLPYANGAYSGTITVDIAAGSTIRKAYLIASKIGSGANPVNVIFNGTPQPFNPSNNAISPPFTQPSYGGASNVHVRDVTNVVSVSSNTYSISVPSQSGPSNRFEDFYLYIAFDNPLLPFVNAYVFLNKLSFYGNIPLNYPLSFATPINTTKPVGLSLMCAYACNTTNGGDGYKVRVDSNLLGTIGAQNPNTPACPACLGQSCAGPHGDFYYYNNVFFGLNGCSNNQSMSGADALSDVRGLLAQGATSFVVNVATDVSTNHTNCVFALFVTYMDNVNTYECTLCGDYTATFVTNTTARLSWLIGCPTTLPASFINTVQYRPIGSPIWIQVNTSAVTFLDITGLSPNTPYEWQVINLDYNGAQCAPSGIQAFTTL